MSSVVPLRSSSCLSPDLVFARPFPSVLTTMAFDHSRRRWFGTCPCRPVPRGLPSSVKQLRTTQPFGLSRSWRTMVGNPYLGITSGLFVIQAQSRGGRGRVLGTPLLFCKGLVFRNLQGGANTQNLHQKRSKLI